MRTNLQSFFPKNIVMVGCGGTGSWIMHSLVHFVWEAYSKNLISSFEDVTFWLIDFDQVEAKNCVRQIFFPRDLALIKSTVLKQRYGSIISIKDIPEAFNAATAHKIFTPEILKENLCVISAVDKKEVSSQLYHFLIEQDAAGNMGNWSWHYTGGQLVKQTVQSTFRETSYELTVPYITTLTYGRFDGVPLTGGLLKPHEVYTDLLNPLPSEAVGMTSSGLLVGCGMSDEEDVLQTSDVNMAAARYLKLTINMLYFEGVVLAAMRENNLTTSTEFMGTLDELLYPDEFPELKNEIKNYQNKAYVELGDYVSEELDECYLNPVIISTDDLVAQEGNPDDQFSIDSDASQQPEGSDSVPESVA
jgi:hypothetical protein